MDGPINPETFTIPKEIKDIGYFRVTERPFETYLKQAHINSDSIPENGVVLNIGAGFEQKFEKSIKQDRPDLTILPIDPSLAIPAEEKNYQTYKNQGIKLEIKPENEEIREPTEEERRKRLKNVLKTSIATIAPRLPIKSSAVDLIIDLAGAFLYLPVDGNERRDYLSELTRILKVGGEAHIYPVEYYGENVEVGDPDQRIKNEKKNLDEILSELKIQHEYYEEIDPKLNEKRLGLVIKK